MSPERIRRSIRRLTPSTTSAGSSCMSGAMNPTLAIASICTAEMSHRIDNLPSRRRSRVRRILMPAGEGGRMSSATRAASAAWASAARRLFLFRVPDRNAVNPFPIFDRDVVGHNHGNRTNKDRNWKWNSRRTASLPMAKSFLTGTTDPPTVASLDRCKALSVLGPSLVGQGTESLPWPSTGICGWVRTE